MVLKAYMGLDQTSRTRKHGVTSHSLGHAKRNSLLGSRMITEFTLVPAHIETECGPACHYQDGRYVDLLLRHGTFAVAPWSSSVRWRLTNTSSSRVVVQNPRRRRRRIAAIVGLRRGRAARPWFVQVLYLSSLHDDLLREPLDATGARYWFGNNVKMMVPPLVELVKRLQIGGMRASAAADSNRG